MNTKIKDVTGIKRTDGLSLYSTDQSSGGVSLATGVGKTSGKPDAVSSVPSKGNTGYSGGVDFKGHVSTGGASTGNVYLDEIQKAASEKNYKTLLQSDIAAYNLKMNTQKYLNNSLASSGLNTQGYGTSAHVGAENAAQNLYAENLANYNEAEQTAQTAAEARADTKATESDNQLVTYLQYSDGSDGQIASYMANYGYKQDENGVWRDADGNAASAYVLSAIESAKNNNSSNSEAKFAEAATSGKTGVNAEAMKAKGEEIVQAYKGNTAAMSKAVDEYYTSMFGSNWDKYKNEIDYMLNNSSFQEQVADGLTVHLVNGSNDSYGAYFVYYNGSWYKTDSDTFAKASNKQTIKGK